MLGLLLAMGVAAALFARMHPAGAGIGAGLEFGVLLAVFQLGARAGGVSWLHQTHVPDQQAS